ncbi:MAG: tetratricopeptide repeat protein [Actinomycetota bacterium]
MGAAELPSGVVTFVITDIEGSTRLLTSLGNDYDAILDRHNELLRSIWADHAGAVVNTEGDSFIVAFESAANAVTACAAAQAAIANEAWPAGPLMIRIGAHRGPALPRNGDYIALALHQTARVSAAANGGQTLVTREVLDAALSERDVESIPLGKYRLRDFGSPTELHLVVTEGLPPTTTPLRALPADSHNLPRAITAMVDREDAFTRLGEVVVPGTLTTVCGPGGIGKTRLAVEFGRAESHRWTDGIWMCSLAALTHGADIPGAIAEALNLRVASGADPLEQLGHLLVDRTMVLVLDNCEAIAPDAAHVVHHLLARCPTIAVLSTSREPLGLTGERQVRVEPLVVPPDKSAALGPATELFLMRARDAGAEQLGDLEIVEQLCERVDGIPLAIELAAARTSVMAPQEILDGLDEHSRALRTADPLSPERHRSIDATIDWSYDLLNTYERAALGRLTVLRSSFDMATAVAVCSGGDINDDDVPELIWSLVAKSVVRRWPTEGETRYRLFTTVNKRVGERTEQSDQDEAVRQLAAHLDAIVGPDAPKDVRWASRVEVERDNIRGVIERVGIVPDALRLRLLWSIGRVYDINNEFIRGIEELELRSAEAANRPELVGVLTLLADLRLRIGDVDGAERVLDRADAIAQSTGPATWELGGLARTRGEIALRRDDVDMSEQIAREALAEDAAPQPSARLWNLLGLSRAFKDDYLGATTAFEEELAIWRQIGADTSVAVTHGNLAEAHLRLGDQRQAAQHQLDCLRGANELGRPILVAFSIIVAAHLAAGEEDWATALELQGAADALLASAEYALYDADEQTRSELVERGHRVFGESTSSTALDRGRTMPLQEVVERASALLDLAAQDETSTT